ncbi:MAG: response regulator [Cyclobacteriaceae bacterium]
MNRLLLKQIERLKKTCSDDTQLLQKLQQIVSSTYDDFEKERKRKDHAGRLMSDELLELNDNIRKENKVFVASVLSSIVEGAIIVDSLGKVIEMNHSAVEILGKKDEEFVDGQFCNILKRKTDFDEFLNYYNQEVFDQTTNYIEEYLYDSNEKEIACELSISEYNSKTEHYFIVLIRNISKRKEFEDDIIRSKEEAEQASLSKSDFLSTMSHEIRTPLNAIIGITNIMLMENKDEGNKEYLDLLKTSSNNLLSLINDILDFNKIESGKIEFSKDEFNLYELVRGIVDTYTFKASKKQLLIDLSYDRKVPELVVGDSARLSQVMINLISNAVKFTSEGSVNVRVALEKETASQLHLSLSVKDTGIGISPDEHDQVFDRFVQSSLSDSGEFGGTGLGLAISKKLVELQDGTIELTSDLGKGAEFIVNLAFDKPSADTNETAKDDELEPENITLGNILLVEDNKSNQYVISKFFAKWGWSYDLARNGKEACEMADKKQYDLILMDLNMPVMDGYQATARLRKRANYADTSIVALTASAIVEVQNKAKEAGVTDFMSKPFEPNQLRKIILTYAA